MTCNNIIVTWNVNEEMIASKTNAAKGVMDTMGFIDLDLFEEVAISSTAHNLGRVTKLASYIGINENILQKVEEESPGLLLPTRDNPEDPRIEISNNFGHKKTTVVRPNLQFIKQVFLTTQATYSEVVGFGAPSVDYVNIKKESLAYIHRYGIGMLIMSKLNEQTAKGNRIFNPKDKESGLHSFSGFFATYLADPSTDEIYFGDDWHSEYTNKFPGWAYAIKDIIQNNNINRRDELEDSVSFGMIRPMKIEEAESTVRVANMKNRPKLSIV